MDKEYTKTEDNKLKVSHTVLVEKEYDLDALYTELKMIQARKDADNESRDKEIATVKELINAAEKAGLVATVVEIEEAVTPEVVEPSE